MTFKRLFPVAALGLTLGMGVNTGALAYSYAFADLQVFNGTLTVLPIGSTALTDFGACAAVGCANVSATPTTTSAADASLGGTGTATSNIVDAPVALGTGSVFPDGSTPVNNTWIPEGPSNNVKYAWGDSQIISQQVLDPTNPVNPDGTPNITSAIDVRQVSEANTTDDTLGVANSSTSSQSEFTTFATVLGDGGRIRFDFDAILQLDSAIVDPSTGIQSVASATTTVTITDEAGNIVFTWSAGGAPLGGSVYSNGFSFSNLATNTQDVLSASRTGSFFAVSNDLAAGVYKVSLVATSTARVQASVPEPTTLALLGLGVLGLGASARRARRMRAAA